MRIEDAEESIPGGLEVKFTLQWSFNIGASSKCFLHSVSCMLRNWRQIPWMGKETIKSLNPSRVMIDPRTWIRDKFIIE